MTSSLPWIVRLYCGASRRLLPRELWVEHGRDINEAFYDLYAEAIAAADTFEPVRLISREFSALVGTALEERRAARRDRHSLLALRARPRTSARRPSNRTNPLPVLPNMFESVLHDVRFALRTLRKSPIFAIIAIATLALGIGANAAVFSVVNTVLLQPLPYEDPEELFVVWTNFGRDLPQNWISGPEFLEIDEFNTAFDNFAVFTSSTWSMTGDGAEPAIVRGAGVSGDFFDVLGTPIERGRLLTAADDNEQLLVVVISDAFWRSQLGGRDDVLGSSLILDGDSFQIVGVLPPDFRVHHPNVSNPETLGIFAPFQSAFQGRYDEMGRGSHFLLGFARGRDGVTADQAQADMDAVAARMQEIDGNYDFEGWGLTTYPLHEDLVENVRGALVVLLGAVAFVLLIACLNVANLQLTRAAQRGREIALRTALGAGRTRLVRQLLTEAIVLAGAGAVAGLGLAYWLIEALQTIVPAGLPRADSIGLDTAVLGFAAAATLLTVAVFGVLPGMIATRTNLADTLRDAGRTASAGLAGTRLRTGLVVAEVALALVLLVGAGLLLRSFNGLLNNNPGYRTDSLLTLRVSLPQPKYDIEQAAIFHSQLLERVRNLPGVVAAGGINALPLSSSGGSGTTFAEHSESESADTWGSHRFIEADRRYVTDGYLETMGVELVSGRLFSASDVADGLPVAIVDETFARRFWGEADPLGERVSVEFDVDRENDSALVNVVWREVVGVIRHARTQDLSSDGREQFYAPYAQRPMFGMHLAIRTAGEPTAVASAVRAAVWDIDPEQPISDIATMRERVSSAVSAPRFASILLLSFAGVAMVLAAMGIYGVVSFSVGQRTSEIGVRMALGASSQRVRAMVLRQGMLAVVVGLGIGLAAALGLTRLISGMLYDVSATDPMTFVTVAGLLATVAAVACLIPATRATRVEPVAALREE